MTFVYCFIYLTFKWHQKEKYVDQKRQDNFSCKHGNTLKSMDFSKIDKYFCPPSVARSHCHVNICDLRLVQCNANIKQLDPDKF